MSILQEIVRKKKEELSSTKRLTPLAELKARIRDEKSTVSFQEALKRLPGSPIRLIAEVKKASPSKGLIRENFNVRDIVSIYNKKSVAAISVLTEERYFGGRIDYLALARENTVKPLLRKDFIFDEYQVYEARAYRADALLLIASVLEKSHLADLYALAQELSLDCLVEIHNLKELETALDCNSRIIGINNRNLETMNISLKTTVSLLKEIPDDKIVISESGYESRRDIDAVSLTRTDAVLIGTAIMKSEDIGAKIDELLGNG